MTAVRILLSALTFAVATVGVPGADVPRATRVILMIADGAGYNAWEASAFYQGTRGEQFFDSSPEWVRLAVSTFALRTGQEIAVGLEHGRTQFPSLVYDPTRAWDPTPVAGEARGYPYYFEGYKWLRQAPDSANTATALMTGAKTYTGAINYDGDGKPIEQTLAWLAHRAGKRVGTVSSVSFNHATPAAAGGAHSASRSDYCEIAWEMLTSPLLDVVAGAGHPDFDNNGAPVVEADRREYRDVGSAAIWNAVTGREPLRAGDVVCAADAGPGQTATAEEIEILQRWTVEQGKAEIAALAGGPTPAKLLLVPEVGRLGYWTGYAKDPADPRWLKIGGTLQQLRGSRADPRYTAPGDDPLISSVPSLESLTRVALNALDDDPDGFFLHVEGGAVDWAMHDNQLGRMIEEMIDFERSVEAVIGWIEAHGGWEDTLLIVTADHDHLLAGPLSHTVPFQPLGDRGAGKLPEYRWLSDHHSNHLVPLYARGAGAESLHEFADGEDPFRGFYLDQTEVFGVMRSVLESSGAAE